MTMHAFVELSEEELDRMEGRVAAASIGPWLSNGVDEELETKISVIELGVCNELGTFASIELVGATEADHEFIVNARQDVPRLLNEVRCLRARLQSLGTSLDDLDDTHSMRGAAAEALLMSPSM